MKVKILLYEVTFSSVKLLFLDIQGVTMYSFCPTACAVWSLYPAQ